MLAIEGMVTEEVMAAGKEVVPNVLEVRMAGWRALAPYSMSRPGLDWPCTV